MPRRFDSVRHASTARRTGRRCARSMVWHAGLLFLLSLAPALPGCRTANYTAGNLPAQLRATRAPSSTGINLEQMAAGGVGTSELGPGDLVEITIVSGSGEEKIVPVPARVAQDGTVMVPLIGAVPIGGLEPVIAEQRIAAAAIERGIYRQPYVTLTVKEPAVNRVTVLGAVAKPGVVELPRGSCDLASALAAAGGLSKEASTRIEILHRGNRPFLADNARQSKDVGDGVRLAAYSDPVQTAPYPFSTPTDLRNSSHPADVTRFDLAQIGSAGPRNRILEDRDVVMVVPREKQVIHVTGLVKTPDQYELPQDKDIRVLDAIAMAGGATSLVADKVFVIRQVPSMPQPAVIKVSMAKAKRNGDENLVLSAGDLVSVESTPATMAVETVSKFFRIALGGSVAVF